MLGLPFTRVQRGVQAVVLGLASPALGLLGAQALLLGQLLWCGHRRLSLLS